MLIFAILFQKQPNIGEVVEWSITAVLKTVELRGSGGSNPSLSANNLKLSAKRWAFFVQGRQELDPVRTCAEKLKGRKAVSFKSFARAPRRAGREKAREAWLIPHSGPVLRYLLKTHWNALSFK